MELTDKVQVRTTPFKLRLKVYATFNIYIKENFSCSFVDGFHFAVTVFSNTVFWFDFVKYFSDLKDFCLKICFWYCEKFILWRWFILFQCSMKIFWDYSWFIFIDCCIYKNHLLVYYLNHLVSVKYFNVYFLDENNLKIWIGCINTFLESFQPNRTFNDLKWTLRIIFPLPEVQFSCVSVTKTQEHRLT